MLPLLIFFLLCYSIPRKIRDFVNMVAKRWIDGAEDYIQRGSLPIETEEEEKEVPMCA